MVSIDESGMLFGEFDEADVFLAEKSLVYKSLGEGVSTVEFVLRRFENEILFIEARQSSPRPENNVDFDTFIDTMYRKFAHSIELYFSMVIQRIEDKADEMPPCFKSLDYSCAVIKLLMVINGHEIKWLYPIMHALRRRLKRHIVTWRLELAVINDEQAREYGLLVGSD